MHSSDLRFLVALAALLLTFASASAQTAACSLVTGVV
jgi:hypothetical protein